MRSEEYEGAVGRYVHHEPAAGLAFAFGLFSVVCVYLGWYLPALIATVATAFSLMVNKRTGEIT